MNSTRLDTFHRRSEVRHLLMEGQDHGAKKLTSLINGVRTEIATGTTYEMDQRSHTVIQDWQNEGFKYRGEKEPPVYEPLKDVIALAKLQGFMTVIKVGKLLTQTPLDHWQGCRDKNGDDYQYGLAGSMIYARPKITAKHGVNMAPQTNEEFMATLRKAIEIRDALGPEIQFVLG